MNEVEQLTSTPEGMRLFQRDRFALEVSEAIADMMIQSGVDRDELARRLNKSQSYVMQLMWNANRLTVNDLSDIFLALNRSVRIADRPVSVSTFPLEETAR